MLGEVLLSKRSAQCTLTLVQSVSCHGKETGTGKMVQWITPSREA